MPGGHGFDYDYAILTLKEKLTFSKTGPVAACLPSIQANQQWSDYAGKDAMTSGWGATNQDYPTNTNGPKEIKPDRLKELNVKVWSTQDCIAEYAKKGKIAMTGGANTE